MESARTAVRALAHPMSLAAIGLLVLNDHVLKDLVPGPVTGKLSDVAGLVFFPLLLGTVIGFLVRESRTTLRVSILVTGTWFVAVNTIPQVAWLTEQLVGTVIGWRITVDPTDLLALPALGVSALIWRRVEVEPRRITVRSGLSPLQLGAVIVGAAASLATSCGVSPGVQFLEWEGELLIAAEEPTWGSRATSTDGGHTWTDWASDSGSDTTLEATPSSEACLPDRTDHCFRIDGGPHVEESLDGGATWRLAWQLPPGREEFLARYGDACDPYQVSAVDLLITDPPDSLVLVAMSDDGLMRRLPDGTWERDVLGMAAPLTEFNENITSERFVALAAMLSAFLAFTLRAHHILTPPAARRLGGWARFGMYLFGIAVIATWLRSHVGADTLFDPMLTTGVFFLALVGMSGPMAVWSRINSQQPRITRIHAVITGIAVLALGAGVLVPFIAWSGGLIARWSSAAAISTIAGVVVVYLTWRGLSRAPTPEHPAPEDEDATPFTSPSASRRPAWIAGSTIAIGGTAIIVGISSSLGAVFIPIGIAGVYLGARLSGYRRPAAMTTLAVAAASLPIVLVSTWVPASGGVTLTAGFVLAVIALRPPNRRAIIYRVLSTVPIIVVARYLPYGVIGPVLGTAAVLAIDLVAAVHQPDAQASRAPAESDVDS